MYRFEYANFSSHWYCNKFSNYSTQRSLYIQKLNCIRLNNITILIGVTVSGITHSRNTRKFLSFLNWMAQRVIYLKITISNTQRLAVSHTSPQLPLISWWRRWVWRHNSLRPLITPDPSTQLCCAKEFENVWQSNLMPQLVFWTQGDDEKWPAVVVAADIRAVCQVRGTEGNRKEKNET